MRSSSPDRLTVLVTGADQHQGLAIIRALGLAGVSVIACGAHAGSLGFYSRYATRSFRYTSPFHDRRRFVDDILAIARRTTPALILPGIESTLIALDGDRARVEREAMLAAPPSDTLAIAIDKHRTLQLADQLGVPVPRTVHGESLAELLERAAGLRFPVAIKPRGNSLHATTAHPFDFKVRYARSLDELRRVLLVLDTRSAYPLVQEYAMGVGLCVEAVCREGVPVAMVAYRRQREFPLSGGVSVMRETVRLDACAARYVSALFGAMRWHGAAMVEFKYDERERRYTLMEINGRVGAAIAVSLDAGSNLPYLAACVHLGRDVPQGSASYAIGTRTRWLRGDLLALRDHVARSRQRSDADGTAPLRASPSMWHVVRAFMHDFRPGTHYDEFKWWDWKPGVVEAIAIGALLARWAASALVSPARVVLRPVKRRLVRRLA